jgi:hypothetical protein
VTMGWHWLPEPDMVTGYSLHPECMRSLYERPDPGPLVRERIELFRAMHGWLEP